MRLRPSWVLVGSYWLGACLGLALLSSLLPTALDPLVGVLGGVATAAWWCWWTKPAGWLVALSLLLVAATWALWLYLAIAFGVLLAWTLPPWGWLLCLLLALVAAASQLRPPQRRFLHPLLPLGLWIVLVLAGWPREEELLRCDDYLALSPGAELVMPTHADLHTCRPGEVRPAGRFPRTTWESPAGDRLVFTTQGLASGGGADGAACEMSLESAPARPSCVGRPQNKSQGLIDLPEQNRLLVMQWGVRGPGGKGRSVLLELTREPPLTLLAEHWSEEVIGDGFYEPRNRTLYLFSDEMDGIHRVRLPDFEVLPPLPIELIPGEFDYDPARGEGVACGSSAGAAIRGEPFELRYLEGGLLEQVGMTWGCDWDAERRKVYVALPNLGLLDQLDYDTGAVEQRWFVGLGKRSVAYDAARQKVYFTDFLRGTVEGFDLRRERITERWFVGRFSRWVRLSRDGSALWATGNLGIVRIALPGRSM